MRTSAIYRHRLLYAGVLFVGAVLIAQLFNLQILNGEKYVALAGKQYAVSSAGLFDRGTIFFTEKDGRRRSAAALKTGFIIAINPSRIADAVVIFDALSAIIPLEEDSFFMKTDKRDDPYEELLRRADEDTARAIEALGLDGVVIVKERWRSYPAGTLAAQVLGFVGYRGDELVGRYGLERHYDDVLRREDEDLYVNFFTQFFSGVRDTLLIRKTLDGDLITSIEPSVASVLESTLADVMEKWDAGSAGGVIIDPMTGDIYAMAALPSFDPNTFNTVSDPSVFSNPTVESVFEMGSIIKPLTMAAGLDAGVVNAETVYDDRGFVIFDGRRVENYDGKARGTVSMQEVLNQSLNTGAAFVMQELGRERFRSYFLSLGLGEETGIDLPGEVTGYVRNLESSRDIEYVTAAFGQGIATTPIATVRALSSLANGGTLVTPRVVSSIDYPLQPERNVARDDGIRVFRSETSEEITRMLVGVVDDALLGGTVALPNYSIAAKTGTAQIAREDGGGYYKDKFLHSFFGYFPAYEPRFLVFLYTIDPKGVRYASQTLTHPFMGITKFLLNYYEVPPDR